MINAAIRKLEDDLIQLINSYELPIEVKRLILKDVENMVEHKADETIKEELKENNDERLGCT